MKKLLSILAAVGLTATASTAAVSCSSSDNETGSQISSQTYENVALKSGKKFSDLKQTMFKITVKDGDTEVKTLNKVEITKGSTEGQANIKVTVDASPLMLAKKTTLSVDVKSTEDADAILSKAFSQSFSAKMPKMVNQEVTLKVSDKVTDTDKLNKVVHSEVFTLTDQSNKNNALASEIFGSNGITPVAKEAASDKVLVGVYTDGTNFQLASLNNFINNDTKALGVSLITLGQFKSFLNDNKVEGADKINTADFVLPDDGQVAPVKKIKLASDKLNPWIQKVMDKGTDVMEKLFLSGLKPTKINIDHVKNADLLKGITLSAGTQTKEMAKNKKVVIMSSDILTADDLEGGDFAIKDGNKTFKVSNIEVFGNGKKIELTLDQDLTNGEKLTVNLKAGTFKSDSAINITVINK